MAHSDHIVSGFDRDLEGIQAQIMRMGGLVEEAISNAAIALETRDLDLAIRTHGKRAHYWRRQKTY